VTLIGRFWVTSEGTGCDFWGTYGACNAFLSTMTPNCTGPYDLNALLDASGAGWVLKEATAINDSHQIVGYGIAPNGEHHAFLLTLDRWENQEQFSGESPTTTGSPCVAK
jgi:hypothetical protein